MTNEVKWGEKSMKKASVQKTWSEVLKNENNLPKDWTRETGVVVGIGRTDGTMAALLCRQSPGVREAVAPHDVQREIGHKCDCTFSRVAEFLSGRVQSSRPQ
ncbi:hypothetical protein C8R43DRAFT_1013049 [Mycena crocata]|nr:hypothetical protein C8R43DRAFT_1013049 [Mycena crocata]